MKSLKTYIIENQQINEVILGCLLGAFAGWGIKTTFKAVDNRMRKTKFLMLNDIWSLIVDNLNDNNKAIINEEENKRKKIEASNIKPIQIPNKEILMNAIKATKPTIDKDGKNGTGLFTIIQKIKDIPELKEIDKAPYFPNYAAFVSKDKEILGMFGFSVKYWKAKLKDNNKEIANLAKKFKNFLHIFDMQICPEYDEKPIYDVVWNIFDKMEKEVKAKGITIRYDNDEEKEIYKKHGFEEIENIKDYLVKYN